MEYFFHQMHGLRIVFLIKQLTRILVNIIFNLDLLTSNTLIKNVKKVLPRKILKYNYETKNINEIEYFNIPHKKNSIKVDVKTLENNLLDTIKKNLISDTKVGVFLSGGIDSA